MSPYTPAAFITALDVIMRPLSVLILYPSSILSIVSTFVLNLNSAPFSYAFSDRACVRENGHTIALDFIYRHFVIFSERLGSSLLASSPEIISISSTPFFIPRS